MVAVQLGRLSSTYLPTFNYKRFELHPRLGKVLICLSAFVSMMVLPSRHDLFDFK